MKKVYLALAVASGNLLTLAFIVFVYYVYSLEAPDLSIFEDIANFLISLFI